MLLVRDDRDGSAAFVEAEGEQLVQVVPLRRDDDARSGAVGPADLDPAEVRFQTKRAAGLQAQVFFDSRLGPRGRRGEQLDPRKRERVCERERQSPS